MTYNLTTACYRAEVKCTPLSLRSCGKFHLDYYHQCGGFCLKVWWILSSSTLRIRRRGRMEWLIVSFGTYKILNFDEVLSIFSCVICAFTVASKKTLPNPRSQGSSRPLSAWAQGACPVVEFPCGSIKEHHAIRAL